MAFSDETLLDVSLQRDGQIRRWNIRATAHGWACTVESPGHITSDDCPTRQLALAKMREWQREIDAARADGWH